MESGNFILREATRYRRSRFKLFQRLLLTAKRPLCVLDVGGLESYWHQVGFVESPDIHITLLNLHPVQVQSSQFSAVVGDACHMTMFVDTQFDLVYSNSVIEHVGAFTEQMAMAREVRRVGKAYFVQTPNRGFFIEPHFFVPFMHWLPLKPRLFVARHFALQVSGGGLKRRLPDEEMLREVAEIRLLSRKELSALFPDAAIWTERLFGLAKSFIVYGRWNQIRAVAAD